MTLEDIYNKLHKLEQLILKQNYKPFNLVEAAEYLSRSQSDIYKLTRQRKIPCHKPTGKYLYFFRDELDEWVKDDPASRKKDKATLRRDEGIEWLEGGDPASPHSGVKSDEELRRDEEEEEPP